MFPRGQFISIQSVVMSGIQLQSSLHVNRKPIINNQAAEQRNILTTHEAVGDGDPQFGVVFQLRPCVGE
jgi:hypothetical protein